MNEQYFNKVPNYNSLKIKKGLFYDLNYYFKSVSSSKMISVLAQEKEKYYLDYYNLYIRGKQFSRFIKNSSVSNYKYYQELLRTDRQKLDRIKRYTFYYDDNYVIHQIKKGNWSLHKDFEKYREEHNKKNEQVLLASGVLGFIVLLILYFVRPDW